MSRIDNLDEVINQITQKVAERLQQMGVAPAAPASVCGTSDADCSNCGQCVVRKPDAVNNIIKSGADRVGTKSGVGHAAGLAKMIDHTLLKPNTTKEELRRVCEEALQYGFATVCVNTSNIPFVARMLRGSDVKPIAVVGFPLGAASTQSKVFEAKEAIRGGAQEIDMVINLGALKSKDYEMVYNDIRCVVEACRPHKVKVILEMSELTEEEKVIGCALSKTARAAFVKTSTGFSSGGATVEDVKLMRRIVGNDVEVKASGGIHSTEDAKQMIAAGANRIGASAGIAIVTGKKTKTKGY